jgi:hypothetical protein
MNKRNKTAPAKSRKPSRLGRFARRRVANFARRHRRGIALAVLALIAGAVASVALRSPWPLIAAAGGLAAVLADRAIEHWAHVHRRGGRIAARHRRRYQGMARSHELWTAVSLAAVRRRCAHLRPSLGGRVRRLAPDQAGIALGEIVRTR